MSELIENPKELENQTHKPIGEILLGVQDPRSLSLQDFNKNPSLLYHGTKAQFEFDPNYDYLNNLGPNSRTVGQGFYTTPNIVDAKLYSRAFGAREGTEVVVSLLPYHAKLFDFRDSQNISNNAPVPINMLISYRDFVAKRLNAEFPEQPKDYNRWYQNLREYRSLLNGMIFGDRPIDLREMLSLIGDKNASEFGSSLFRSFILQQNLDGVVYIEGGDHKDQNNPVSYIFFNLDKIGTYDSWQKKIIEE